MMLEIKDIHKNFGKTKVLKGINLNVSEKDIVVIIGPSGSGKSTLLRVINELEKPNKGQIIFEGKAVTNVDEYRKKVGMVFQHFNLFPHLTVLDNLILAPVKLKIKNKEDAYFGIVNSIAELFDYLDNMEAFSSQTVNRVIAGYTRPWISKKDKSLFDWVEGDHQWKWNSTNKNWINKPNSRSEIGCIHSVQGVDLNYVGVIISNDIEIIDGELHGNIINYKDENGKFAKADFSQKGFDDYIKNIYYVLLSRGISGIRVYFEDKKMEKYFKKFMEIEE